LLIINESTNKEAMVRTIITIAKKTIIVITLSIPSVKNNADKIIAESGNRMKISSFEIFSTVFSAKISGINFTK
jgi:hypothetical protein